jgi:hypothetical protein
MKRSNRPFDFGFLISKRKRFLVSLLRPPGYGGQAGFRCQETHSERQKTFGMSHGHGVENQIYKLAQNIRRYAPRVAQSLF